MLISGMVSLLLCPHEHLLIRNKGSLLDKTLWIEMEVRSSQRIYLPLTHFDIAKASVQHCQEALHRFTNVGTSRSVSFIAAQVESVSRFNDIFAKVRPEIFLRSAVASRFFFRHGRTNWPINQTRHSTNSEAVRLGRILACT